MQPPCHIRQGADSKRKRRKKGGEPPAGRVTDLSARPGGVTKR